MGLTLASLALGARHCPTAATSADEIWTGVDIPK
jgi:hypothetical protein